MYNLKPYQNQAVERTFEEWGKGNKRTLVVVPTAGGKTVIFGKIIHKLVTERSDRVLVIAHQQELLDHAAETIREYGIDCVQGQEPEAILDSDVHVLVASKQLMANRAKHFPEGYFDAVVIDEAHHAVADGYQKILRRFPGANVLGVTATPKRGDKKDVMSVFDSVALEYTLAQAVEDNHLCKATAQMVPLSIDLTDTRVINGDYDKRGIGNKLDGCLEEIAYEMEARCRHRHTVAFLPLVDTARKFRDVLERHGFRAAEIDGKTPKAERRAMLQAFERGEIDVLCNAMLLTEGWNCPPVDCIVNLRATRSETLYRQIVGRGMRVHPGKEDLLLLDFLWLTEKYSLCRPSCLAGADEAVTERIDRMVAQSDNGIDVLSAEKQAKEEIVREREEKLAEQLRLNSRRKAKTVDPISHEPPVARAPKRKAPPFLLHHDAEPTEKQLAVLAKRKIDTTDVKTRAQAHALISQPSPAQAEYLSKKGFRNVKRWTFTQACYVMGMLQRNGWNVPNGIDPATYMPRKAA